MTIQELRKKIGTVTSHGAISVIDSRIQMRGKRPAITWTVYLSLLVGICLISYAGHADYTGSVVMDQGWLNDFTRGMQACLTALILLITPGLVSASISNERRKGTLDMVFSAPVSPFSYISGKLLAAYKNIWMLLALSLPIVAVGYVMGGATFADLGVTYLLISLNALVVSALAAAISCARLKPTAAIVLSYLGCGVYQFVVSSLPSAGAIQAGGSSAVTWTSGLSGFTASMAAPAFTMIGPWAVPVWIPTLFVSLGLCAWAGLGASSALTRYNSRETKAFRAVSLVGVYLVSLGLCGAFNMPWNPSVGLAAFFMPVLATIPFYSVVDPLGERKWRSTGWFSRRILAGEPASAVPFTMALMVASVAGSWQLPFRWEGLETNQVAFGVYCVAVATLAALGVRRLSLTKMGARGAKFVYFGIVASIMTLPSVVFVWLSSAGLVGPELSGYLPVMYGSLPASATGPLLFGLAWSIGGCLILGAIEATSAYRSRLDFSALPG